MIQRKVFTFNGVSFSTRKAFFELFPAYRAYWREVERGEAKDVADVERIISERNAANAKVKSARGWRTEKIDYSNRGTNG